MAVPRVGSRGRRPDRTAPCGSAPYMNPIDRTFVRETTKNIGYCEPLRTDAHMTFYQQCRIWRDKGAGWKAFNPAKPLWVFLGKTVKGSNKADRATRSDVVRILTFLGWVLGRGDAVRPMIGRLLEGRSGLLDDAGDDYFAGRFSHLPRTGADLYGELCELLFHGQGRLHVVYLTAGEGELHLARRGQRAVRGRQRGGLGGALQAALRERQTPTSTSTGRWASRRGSSPTWTDRTPR